MKQREMAERNAKHQTRVRGVFCWSLAAYQLCDEGMGEHTAPLNLQSSQKKEVWTRRLLIALKSASAFKYLFLKRSKNFMTCSYVRGNLVSLGTLLLACNDPWLLPLKTAGSGGAELWHTSAGFKFGYSVLLTQVPANMPERQWMMTQVPGALTNTWDTQMEFLSSGFCLAQPWLLQEFGEWTSR